ncbi:MAG: prolyl-tRNA synthetase associated domain-containing protein [Methyloceanibacter sp.]
MQNTPSDQGSRAGLFGRLEALGIASTTVEYAPVFTVEESKGLRDRLPGAHTKNLFLEDKDGRLVLVVAKEDTKVDLKELARKLRFGRFSFGKPGLLKEVLGIEPGSVTPFALINDVAGRVTVVIDAALMALTEVNCHPLQNSATTRLATGRSSPLHRSVRPCAQTARSRLSRHQGGCQKVSPGPFFR